jgi:hypothetical protein
MNISRFLLIALIGATMGLASCNSKKDASTSVPETTVTPSSPTQTTTMSTSAPGSEPHYKCPTPGCTGGGAAQGQCPICGADLQHNDAYHAQQQMGNPAANPVIDMSAQGAMQQNAPAAQNAQGVFHYTCPKGCAGGAGMAGMCSNCGTELVHNQAYHN